jgi:hypothetical protein
MSLARKSSAETKLAHEPELGIDAIVPPRFDLDGDTGLQNELDRILARKPVARPTVGGMKPANTNLIDFDAVKDSGDGFTWEPDAEVEGAANPVSTVWLDKARRDKRSNSRRNAAAWVSTLVIGAAILAASAYFLIGWRPDFGSAYSTAMQWFSQTG